MKNDEYNKIDKFLVGSAWFIVILYFILAAGKVYGEPIVHKFKNPSFSGVGTGAHYLTIENQEHSRKKAIRDALDAAERAAQREIDNSTLSKFIRNLESRIYAQLAKQLVDNMFSNDDAVTFGSFTLEGAVITYEVITNADGTEVIKMTIIDEDGTTTVIELPIGTGNFGSENPDGG